MNGRMNGMSATRKVKVSLTLSPALLSRVDRAAKREGRTRSYMVERWLTSGASRAAELALEHDLLAYYTSRTEAERAEEAAIANASARAARNLEFDDVPPPRRIRSRRRR